MKKILFIFCFLLCTACAGNAENQARAVSDEKGFQAAQSESIQAAQPAKIGLEEVRQVVAAFSRDKNLELQKWGFPYDVPTTAPITVNDLKEENYGYQKVTEREKILKILSVLFKHAAQGTPEEKMDELRGTRDLFEFYSPENQKYLMVYLETGLHRGEKLYMQFEIKHGSEATQSQIFYVKNPDEVMDILGYQY